MNEEIQLLQFLICKEFKPDAQDAYTAEGIHSNVYAAEFPYRFGQAFAVTCWRKDARFHKEVIEYETDYGKTWRSPHMDIEPVTNSVLFRWHKHPFPTDLEIDRPTTLTARVILDRKVLFETYLLIEAAG